MESHEKVVSNYPSADKRRRLTKYLMLWPKIKGGGPGRRRSSQEKSPFLNFWSHILIWDSEQVLLPSAIINSLWILFEPPPFIRKYLATNLCSSFSIYRQ
jgi:hypothetical protein